MSCDLGTQTRERKIAKPDLYGGAVCPALVEQRSCSAGVECKRDCELGKWSEWGRCSFACTDGAGEAGGGGKSA